MPSTHISLHYHLIFSTKDRVAFIHKDWRGRLHAYMGGIINDLGGISETIVSLRRSGVRSRKKYE